MSLNDIPSHWIIPEVNYVGDDMVFELKDSKIVLKYNISVSEDEKVHAWGAEGDPYIIRELYFLPLETAKKYAIDGLIATINC